MIALGARRLLALVLVPLLLAAVAPASAATNDRALRAFTIPPSACQLEPSRTQVNSPATGGLSVGTWYVRAPINTGAVIALECPLPLSNVALSSTTGAVKMAKFRIRYVDSDGVGLATNVKISLKAQTVTTSSSLLTSVCSWNSDQNGSGTPNLTTATQSCDITLQPNTNYYFDVKLFGNSPFGTVTAQFLGIDFP